MTCTELSDHSPWCRHYPVFQLRRSRGGCEKFHGAVIAHVGTNDTRVFRETAQLGMELESFGTKTLGTRNKSDVGIIFDWDNYWALEYTSGPTRGPLKYVDQIHHYYEYFLQQKYLCRYDSG